MEGGETGRERRAGERGREERKGGVVGEGGG